MIKLLNLVEEGSTTQGWKVKIVKEENGENSYWVRLDAEGSELKLRLSPEDYNDLTTPHGVRVSAPARLIPTSQGPVAVLAEQMTDVTIALINLEIGIFDVVSGFRLENFELVDYEVAQLNNRNRISMILVSRLPLSGAKVSISYGFEGGKVEVIQSVEYADCLTPTLAPTMTKTVNRVEELRPIEFNFEKAPYTI